MQTKSTLVGTPICLRSVAGEFQKGFVNRGVVGQLRMKCGRKNAPLPDEHGMACIFCDDFDSVVDRFDDRSSNEDHFKRLFAELRGAEMNVAGKLAPVTISQDRDIEQAERRLRRSVDLTSKKDRPGAGAKKCAAIRREFLERVEQAFFGHHFEVRGALTSRQNYAGQP